MLTSSTSDDIIYAATKAGVKRIFNLGAQAVAAMAYGTQTVPKVLKIFGPGNQFVTMAALRYQTILMELLLICQQVHLRF